MLYAMHAEIFWVFFLHEIFPIYDNNYMQRDCAQQTEVVCIIVWAAHLPLIGTGNISLMITKGKVLNENQQHCKG